MVIPAKGKEAGNFMSLLWALNMSRHEVEGGSAPEFDVASDVESEAVSGVGLVCRSALPSPLPSAPAALPPSNPALSATVPSLSTQLRPP